MGFMEKVLDIVVPTGSPKVSGFTYGYYKGINDSERDKLAAYAQQEAARKKQEAEMARLKLEQTALDKRKQKELDHKTKEGKLDRGNVLDAAKIKIQAELLRHNQQQALTAQQSLIDGITSGDLGVKDSDYITKDGWVVGPLAQQIVFYPRYLRKPNGSFWRNDAGALIENPDYVRGRDNLKSIIKSASKNKAKFNEYRDFPEAYNLWMLSGTNESFKDWILTYNKQPTGLIQEYNKYEQQEIDNGRTPMSFEKFWRIESTKSASKDDREYNLKIYKEYLDGDGVNIWLKNKDGHYVRDDKGKKQVTGNTTHIITTAMDNGHKLTKAEIYQIAVQLDAAKQAKMNGQNEKSKSVRYGTMPVIGTLFRTNSAYENKIFYYGDTKNSGDVSKYTPQQASQVMRDMKDVILAMPFNRGMRTEHNETDRLIHFFDAGGDVGGFNKSERTAFLVQFAKLGKALSEPQKITRNNRVTTLYPSTERNMPHIMSVLKKLAPNTHMLLRNNSGEDTISIEVETTNGQTKQLYTHIDNGDASQPLVKSIVMMKTFLNNNSNLKPYADRLLRQDTLSYEDYKEMGRLIVNADYKDNTALEEIFKDNPFMFIPYFQAAGYGNFQKEVGPVDTAVTRLKTLGKPRKNSDHKVFYDKRQKKKRALQDTKAMVADMIVTQTYLTGGETVGMDNATLSQAIDSLGELAATTTGSNLVKGISSTVETLVTGLKTFVFEFEQDKFNLSQLNATLSSQIGQNDINLDEKANAEFKRSREIYDKKIEQIKLSTSENSSQRTQQMKAARHRLGLRSAMTFKKIALTYKLAGLVQGDQTGGRTISNEDFHQVYSALWSGGEVGNRAVLGDLSNDLKLRIQKEQAYDLLHEMHGTGVSTTIEDTIDSIFEDKRREFYTRTGNNTISAQTFRRIAEGGEKVRANYIISGQEEIKTFNTFNSNSINRKLKTAVNEKTLRNFARYIHNVSIDGNAYEVFNIEKDGYRMYNGTVTQIVRNAYRIYDGKEISDKALTTDDLNKLVDGLTFSNLKDTYRRDSSFIKNYLKDIISTIDKR